LDALRGWARTLPDRHGGRRLLWPLLGILALALAARVLAAVYGIEVRNGSDADMYERLAVNLYRDGEYGLPGSANPYDFAPGVPLFAAAIYNLIGAASPVAARVGLALAGTVAVVVVYLLARRLGGPRAGVVAAALAAVYPATLYYAGLLAGEPLAMLTVPAAVLGFLWAADPGRSPWAWAVPGALLGVTAFLRPEYVALTATLALLAAAVVMWRSGVWRGAAAGGLLALAFAAVVAPWALHASSELGRFVPVSTGGGKALFIGTYLPGDGLHEGVKQHLLHRIRGGDPIPPDELREIPMNPLLDRVAQRYPDIPRDEALGRVGRDNLIRWATGEPRAFAQMVAGKVGHMWQGAGAPSERLPGAVLHYGVLALGLAGLALLTLRRRWEVLPIVALVCGISVIGALLLAGTRRNMPVMPLVIALAGVSAVAGAEWARDRLARRRLAEAEPIESALAPR
jgi:4-amino-4-deoxy-L-arabinose transferase-like glycosyltransferase